MNAYSWTVFRIFVGNLLILTAFVLPGLLIVGTYNTLLIFGALSILCWGIWFIGSGFDGIEYKIKKDNSDD